jgi:hypothetical protein
MRTTLTLDEDVAVELERLRSTRNRSLKQLINEALRLGLRIMTASPKKGEPFRTETVSMRCRLPNVDNIAEVLAVAEGENHR